MQLTTTRIGWRMPETEVLVAWIIRNFPIWVGSGGERGEIDREREGMKERKSSNKERMKEKRKGEEKAT